MTVKDDLERESKKLGDSVREALGAFNKATGMKADLGITWVTYRRLEDASDASVVSRVDVSVPGLDIEA